MFARSRLHKILTPWLFLLPLLTNAQTFRYNQYTTHDGLPIDNVYAAAQDDRGFMWFGTDFGIARFDGYRFTNYDHTKGLVNKAVTDIVYAGGDSLLFFSYPFTIQSIHYNGTINTIVSFTGISLQQLVKHGNQYLYYKRGDTRFGILQNGKSRLIKADSLLGVNNIVINCIFSAGDMGVAICTNQGLFTSNNGVVTQSLHNKNIQWGLLTAQKKMVVVSGQSIQEAGNDLDFKPLPFSLPPDFYVYHMAEEKDGAIWLRGLDKGIYRMDANRLQEMSDKLRMENKALNEFFGDADGNFWFCTDGSGVLLKKRSAFINYETQDGLANNKVIRLLQQKNDLLIGTSNGLSIMQNNKIKTMDLPVREKGLKYIFQMFPVSNTITGICMDKFFGTKDSIHSIADVTKDFSFGEHHFRAFHVNFASQQDENTAWILSNGMLGCIKDSETKITFDISAYKVKKGYCMIAYENKLWFGTDVGIIVVDKDKISLKDPAGTSKPGQVFNFVIDQKNRLWIATDVGLFMYDQGHFTAMAKGTTAASNYCKDIAMDNEGKIWAATWDGIFVMDGDKKISINTKDGLPSKTTNCIVYDTAAKQIYIGTDNGLAVLSESALRSNGNRRDIFISCNIAGKDSLLVNNDSTLSAEQNSLAFYLSFPYYQAGEDVVYEYKIDHGNWVMANVPVIIISDIASGKHIFYARAKVNGETVSQQEATFTFTIKKPFYKQWWFWLIAILFSQFIIFRVIDYYNKKAREEKLAEQTQQAEYASLKQQAFTLLMNPHFIFNALNSVQHYVNRQDRQSANKYLSDFATLIRRSFDAAQRSFVTLEEELETIRLYLQLEKMRFADKFDYTIMVSAEAASEDWMLPSMVLQPFLENAVLHGLMPLPGKGLLTIDASVQHNSLRITITDNGIGIEKSKAYRSGGTHKSKGMQLIKERLGLLSKLSKEPIELIITENTPGAVNPGTKIILVIPEEVYEVFQKQKNPA